MSTLEAVILAAGTGTRMHSDRPKVMHEIAGVPMLRLVLDTVRSLNPGRIHVVVAPGQSEALAQITDDDVQFVVQEHPSGTGAALATAIAAIQGDPELLVLYGDTPLLRSENLARMCKEKTAGTTSLVILTTEPEEPAGYGRVVRDASGNVLRVVEQLNATAVEARLREINVGSYLAKKSAFEGWLNKVQPNDLNHERYLTDVVALAAQAGGKVAGLMLEDTKEAMGVNDKAGLAAAEAEQQRRLTQVLLDAGVTLADPTRLTIRGKVDFGVDCQIDVGVVLAGPLHCGDRVQIGPYCVLKDCQIENDAVIEPFCHLEGCLIGRGARVGPYARVRPGSHLGPAVQVGNFIEVNRSSLGEGTKAKHFAYLGDAYLGRDCNVSAGVVTGNYDGQKKSDTKTGDRVFIGSNTTLIAPLHLGDDAYVGGGTTLTRSVEDGQLVAEKRAPLKEVSRKRLERLRARNVKKNDD